VATATGASATFELRADDDQPLTYEVRAGERTERITVFPADTVTSLDHADANAAVRTYAVVPSTLSRATQLLLVMHGKGRNADEYCQSWVDWAAKADYIVLCPQFDEDEWPGSAGYNLGNVFTGEDGSGRVNPEEEWAFTVAERVHRHAATNFALEARLFDMWGHSAGAQFVHRFVLFKPRSLVRYAIAANPGWYTAADPATAFPYGLQHPALDLGESYTREHLVIMRGEGDVVRDDNLRTEPGAEAQGHTRFERAGFAYAAARATDPDTNWQLIDVPGADHDQVTMSAAAQRFLLETAAALPRSCPLPNGDVCPN
jgi:poly(3-hydroxybutyrate) depolymerase